MYNLQASISPSLGWRVRRLERERDLDFFRVPRDRDRFFSGAGDSGFLGDLDLLLRDPDLPLAGDLDFLGDLDVLRDLDILGEGLMDLSFAVPSVEGFLEEEDLWF